MRSQSMELLELSAAPHFFFNLFIFMKLSLLAHEVTELRADIGLIH